MANVYIVLAFFTVSSPPLQPLIFFIISLLPNPASDISQSIPSSIKLHRPRSYSNHLLAILPSSALKIPTAISNSSGG
jgi:hypothetical protein